MCLQWSKLFSVVIYDFMSFFFRKWTTQCENKLCKGTGDGTFKWSMDISIEVQRVGQMLPAGLISSNRINSVACGMQEIIVLKWMAFPLCSVGISKCPVLGYSLCLRFWNDKELCTCFPGTSIFLSAWQSERSSDCREGTDCFVCDFCVVFWGFFFNRGDSFRMKGSWGFVFT